MLGAPSFARTTIPLTEITQGTNKDLDLGLAEEKEYTEQYKQSDQPSRGAY